MSRLALPNKPEHKITLRHWRLEDLPTYEYWQLGNHRWMDFNGPYFANPSPEEVAETQNRLEKAIVNQRWPEILRTAVIAKRDTDELLGTVSWYWQSKETNWISVGLAVYDDKNWGQGIGEQALGLWVDYLFLSDPSLVRLDLRTWSGNPGMIRLGEKVGFSLEACFRKARIVNGAYYDGIGMGILREEWKKLKE